MGNHPRRRHSPSKVHLECNHHIGRHRRRGQHGLDSFNGYGTLVVGGNDRLMLAGGSNGLLISDDGGDNWVNKPVSDNTGAGYLLRSKTGRLIVPATGRSVQNLGEFFVNDGNGETWSGRVAGLQWNEGPNAIVQCKSGRILVPANSFASFNNNLFYSDDDGATWGQVPFETNLPSTNLSDLAVTGDGRLMITGGNAAVFISDSEIPIPVSSPSFSIRKGQVSNIPIERPDVDGTINAHFGLVGSTTPKSAPTWKTGPPDPPRSPASPPTAILSIPSQSPITDCPYSCGLSLRWKCRGELAMRFEYQSASSSKEVADSCLLSLPSTIPAITATPLKRFSHQKDSQETVYS